MATRLGAGKYVFGEDIPEGKYNLKAISGDGALYIPRQLDDKTYHMQMIFFGTAKSSAKTYHGLSLPKGLYFEVTDNVIFEITKSTPIEIE